MTWRSHSLRGFVDPTTPNEELQTKSELLGRQFQAVCVGPGSRIPIIFLAYAWGSLLRGPNIETLPLRLPTTSSQCGPSSSPQTFRSVNSRGQLFSICAREQYQHEITFFRRESGGWKGIADAVQKCPLMWVPSCGPSHSMDT